MKKNALILIALVTVISLTVFGFTNWNKNTDRVKTHPESLANLSQPIIENPNKVDFYFGIGPRFKGVTRTDLKEVKSFNDFIDEDHANSIVSFKSLSVTLLEDNKETDVKLTIEKSGEFTLEQLNLIKSFDYSTNFLIWAKYIQKNETTEELEHNYWSPHLTIVPEKQAVYKKGNDALLSYLRENSKKLIDNTNMDSLKPAKLYFTVTTNGTISNIKLYGTSGYPLIDNRIIELVKEMPGNWEPAENTKGEKVNQKLVISFANMGC